MHGIFHSTAIQNTQGKINGRLEGTQLGRSGNVSRFLVHSGKVMRREGRTQEKQVL